MAVYRTSRKQRNDISCGKYTISLGNKTLLMGILNTTPDSFFDGGRFESESAAADRCFFLAEQGSDIIDIGGESTRPGSSPVSADEEISRTVPVIRRTAGKLRIPISIDTQKAAVAMAALDAGASLINDVSALRDPEMASVAVKYRVPVVLMHMQGTPTTMQEEPKYDDVIDDIKSFLSERINYAVGKGIDEERIIVDPGIGFGKTLEHNLELLQNIDKFVSTGYRVLVGTSRKSFIGKITGRKKPDERIFGTAATVALCVAAGVSIVRVHDVAEMVDAVKVANIFRA